MLDVYSMTFYSCFDDQISWAENFCRRAYYYIQYTLEEKRAQ